jgi:hypothetical protein
MHPLSKPITTVTQVSQLVDTEIVPCIKQEANLPDFLFENVESGHIKLEYYLLSVNCVPDSSHFSGVLLLRFTYLLDVPQAFDYRVGFSKNHKGYHFIHMGMNTHQPDDDGVLEDEV